MNVITTSPTTNKNFAQKFSKNITEQRCFSITDTNTGNTHNNYCSRIKDDTPHQYWRKEKIIHPKSIANVLNNSTQDLVVSVAVCQSTDETCLRPLSFLNFSNAFECSIPLNIENIKNQKIIALKNNGYYSDEIEVKLEAEKFIQLFKPKYHCFDARTKNCVKSKMTVTNLAHNDKNEDCVDHGKLLADETLSNDDKKFEMKNVKPNLTTNCKYVNYSKPVDNALLLRHRPPFVLSNTKPSINSVNISPIVQDKFNEITEDKSSNEPIPLHDKTFPNKISFPVTENCLSGNASVVASSVLPERTILRRQRRMQLLESEEKTEDVIERLNKLKERISGALKEVKTVLKQYSNDCETLGQQTQDEESDTLAINDNVSEQAMKILNKDDTPVQFRFVKKVRRRSVFNEEAEEKNQQLSEKLHGDHIKENMTLSNLKDKVQNDKKIGDNEKQKADHLQDLYTSDINEKTAVYIEKLKERATQGLSKAEGDFIERVKEELNKKSKFENISHDKDSDKLNVKIDQNESANLNENIESIKTITDKNKSSIANFLPIIGPLRRASIATVECSNIEQLDPPKTKYSIVRKQRRCSGSDTILSSDDSKDLLSKPKVRLLKFNRKSQNATKKVTSANNLLQQSEKIEAKISDLKEQLKNEELAIAFAKNNIESNNSNKDVLMPAISTTTTIIASVRASEPTPTVIVAPKQQFAINCDCLDDTSLYINDETKVLKANKIIEPMISLLRDSEWNGHQTRKLVVEPVDNEGDNVKQATSPTNKKLFNSTIKDSIKYDKTSEAPAQIHDTVKSESFVYPNIVAEFQKLGTSSSIQLEENSNASSQSFIANNTKVNITNNINQESPVVKTTLLTPAVQTPTSVMPELQILTGSVHPVKICSSASLAVEEPFNAPSDELPKAKKKMIIKRLVRKNSVDKSVTPVNEQAEVLKLKNMLKDKNKIITLADNLIKNISTEISVPQRNEPDNVESVKLDFIEADKEETVCAELEVEPIAVTIVPKKPRKVKKKVIIKRQERRLSINETFFKEPEAVPIVPVIETIEKPIAYFSDDEEPEPINQTSVVQLKTCIKSREYEIGDVVLYAERFRKTQVRWKKGRVIDRITSISYKLDIDGKEVPAHISYIKRYTDRKVNFGGKEYLEIDYEQLAEEEQKSNSYSIWNMV